MSLKVGNTIPRRLYKGSNLVSRVYKGDVLQWERLTREGRSFVSPADGEVSLDTIYGRSLVWNQLVPDVKIDVPIGTYNYASYVTGLTFTNGHKYLVVLDNSELMVRMIVTGTSYTSTAGQKILVTFTGTTGTGSPYQIQLGGGTSTKVSHIKMHDLTLMFGVDNEPSTVEEFEALFPEPYYDYDTGSILNLGARDNTIDIDVKGFNLWDEEWEGGSIYYTTGKDFAASGYIRSRGYIPVIAGETYYIKAPANTNLIFYDATKAFVGTGATYINKKDTTFTVPSGAAFLRFALGVGTYNHDICINISNPIYNGQYKPYQQEKTVSIPLTTLTSNGEFIFPDGVCGIGTARDEVVENKVIKRIGKVDLGTVLWNYDGTNNVFWAILKGYKDRGDIMSSKYPFAGTIHPQLMTDFTLSNTAYYDAHVFAIKDTSITATTRAEIQVAMSGVMLYYELAEPIEYPLDIPFKVEYEIVEGGSESLVGLTAPIKEDIALNYK